SASLRSSRTRTLSRSARRLLPTTSRPRPRRRRRLSPPQCRRETPRLPVVVGSASAGNRLAASLGHLGCMVGRAPPQGALRAAGILCARLPEVVRSPTRLQEGPHRAVRLRHPCL